MKNKPLNSALQISYATNDIDRAITMMSETYGIEKFMRIGPIDIWVGEGGRDQLTLKVALAYAGDTQIEIVEPVCGATEYYADVLDSEAQFCMRFHHVGFAVKNRSQLDSMREYLELSGHAIDNEGSFGESSAYFYADARKTLGHHIEYILQESSHDALIPRN